MKKIAIFFSMAFLSLFLTSCEVHWFDQSYEVAWWVVAIPTVLILAAAFFFAGKGISKTEYRCTHCQETFYPTWSKAAFSVHVGNDRVFKCPHCGKKDFCKRADE